MLRLAAIADTHLSRVEDLPQCDVLVHAGDIAISGEQNEWCHEIQWLGMAGHGVASRVLYVPGNHDRYSFDYPDEAEAFCAKYGVEMLVDRTVEIKDVTIHGSPWTPNFGRIRAYMHNPEQARLHWSKLPSTDVLITHGPPAGVLDRCPLPVGCPALWDAVRYTCPILHIFGHVHDDHGRTMQFQVESKDLSGRILGTITFANVSRYGVSLKDPSHAPVTDPVFLAEIDPMEQTVDLY